LDAFGSCQSEKRACADALLTAGKPFDVVIANGGVMATPFGRTADGFETQFGTNHLRHFVLINRIAPLIGAGGRLINLSSAGHRCSNVDLQDFNFERAPYDPFVAYDRSKTANILFAVVLTSGIGSVAYAQRLYIREAYKRSWAATWTRAACSR
jgi:NAD(P)-dependent dehydrogenase (short-subunit alcohol dehydrogenase family)